MDGTGRMFNGLIRELPDGVNPQIHCYPVRDLFSYDELLAGIRAPDGEFSILAESFSGPLGIRLAARHASQVRCLILVGTFARSPMRLPGWLRQCFSACAFSFGERIPARLLFSSKAGASERKHFSETIRAVPRGVFAHRLREVLAVDVEAQLRRLTVPILYLRGRQDWVVSRRAVERIRRIQPNVALSEVEAGHLVLQEKPEACARLICEFLRGST